MELVEDEGVSRDALLEVRVHDGPPATDRHGVEAHRAENIPGARHPRGREIQTVWNHTRITVDQHRRPGDYHRGLRGDTLANAAMRTLDERVAG